MGAVVSDLPHGRVTVWVSTRTCAFYFTSLSVRMRRGQVGWGRSGNGHRSPFQASPGGGLRGDTVCVREPRCHPLRTGAHGQSGVSARALGAPRRAGALAGGRGPLSGLLTVGVRRWVCHGHEQSLSPDSEEVNAARLDPPLTS